MSLPNAAVITARDVELLLDLTTELAEIDPAHRVEHALVRLNKLLGSRVGMFAHANVDLDGRPVSMGAGMQVGLERGETAVVENDFFDGAIEHPLADVFRDNARGIVTHRREDVLDDTAWYGSDYVNQLARPAGVDHPIVSKLTLVDGGVTVLVLFRAFGEKPFTARERELAGMFHRSAGKLLRHKQATPTHCKASLLNVEEDQRSASLPPRLKSVLERLLAGDSEKQVAYHLGLSKHTVHEYVKALYRRLDVNSRGELMALFVEPAAITKVAPSAPATPNIRSVAASAA
jgi:DNA-binding CsgD family transcriptional regulator